MQAKALECISISRDVQAKSALSLLSDDPASDYLCRPIHEYFVKCQRENQRWKLSEQLHVVLLRQADGNHGCISLSFLLKELRLSGALTHVTLDKARNSEDNDPSKLMNMQAAAGNIMSMLKTAKDKARLRLRLRLRPAPPCPAPPCPAPHTFPHLCVCLALPWAQAGMPGSRPGHSWPPARVKLILHRSGSG